MATRVVRRTAPHASGRSQPSLRLTDHSIAEPLASNVLLPALLPHMTPSPELSPQCLCCGESMSWEHWLTDAWFGPGQLWASQCAGCRHRDEAFSALLRRTP